MQTTSLINELYVRMLDAKRVSCQNRAHFFVVCARQMRSILVDFFRAWQYQKHGGGAVRITFDESLAVSRQTGCDLVAVDEALSRLTSRDARRGQVVELRFFGGLSVKETAEVLKISPETVMRDWQFAKVWLPGELNPRDHMEAQRWRQIDEIFHSTRRGVLIAAMGRHYFL